MTKGKNKDKLPQYKLERSNRKTIALIITPAREVVVRAPENVSLNYVENFIRRKLRWIEKQLAFFNRFRYAHLKEKEYVSGESFLYLGKRYRLKVEKSDEKRVYLYRGFIIVKTPNTSQSTVKNLLNDWFLSRARYVFRERMQVVAKKFDVGELPSIRIRKMKTRWGSLGTTGNVNLNLLLIHAPKYAIDYVITHELVHYYHKNHGQEFYQLLNEKFPNWKKVKEKLEYLIFNEF